MIDIELEFNKAEYIYDYDKSIDVFDVLPYSVNEVLIQPNELSYYKTFNMKLSYLYDNFMYLYSRCSIPNYDIPTTFNGFIGVTGTNLGIYNNVQSSKNFSFGGYYDLDFAKNAIVYKNKNNNMYYFFVNCLSSIYVMRHDEDMNFCQVCPNKITTVDPISGELSFKKINSLSILEDKYLCVSDEILDSVFKYDLETFFSDDNIFKSSTAPFRNKLFLMDIVGGEGGRYETIKFEHPKNIPTYNNLMLVEDYDNKIFKLFNSNFDFLSYKTFINLYNTISSFQSIKFKNEKEIYGVVKDGYYVFNLDQENYKITLNNFVSLSSSLSSGEVIMDVDFSKYEDNMIYVLTNKQFIKKWDSKLFKSIGTQKAVDFGQNSNFKWMTTISKNVSSDLIYIYTYNSTANANQILIYTDEFDLITNLSDRNFQVYPKEDVLIKKTEWNQSWIYEKNVKKLVRNIESLRNTICYSFIKKEDYYGNLINIEKQYSKDVLTCFDRIRYGEQFTIGLNENFQSSSVNRLLNEIHIIEEELLKFINNIDYVERHWILNDATYDDNNYWRDCETWDDY
jgi:hypothetical protein